MRRALLAMMAMAPTIIWAPAIWGEPPIQDEYRRKSKEMREQQASEDKAREAKKKAPKRKERAK